MTKTEIHKKLLEDGYKLDITFSHSDPTALLKDWLSQKTIITRIFGFFAVLIFALLGALIGITLAKGTFQLVHIFQFIIGLAAVILIIPLHEFIHGLAYYYVGAKKVQYRAVWSKMIFYAIADGFVSNYKNMKIVALAPVISISLIGIFVLMVAGWNWVPFGFGMLGMHYLSSSGDFAILNYMYLKKDKDIKTFDDVEAGESYFYIK